MNVETSYNKKYRDVGDSVAFSLVFGVLGGSIGAAICDILRIPERYHWVPPLPLFGLALATALGEFAADLKTKRRNCVPALVVLAIKLSAVTGGIIGSVLIWWRW